MKSHKTWSSKAIPDLPGKRILITGANSGIGFEAAKALAAKGAEVVMACRDSAKATQAIDKIVQENPAAFLGFVELDLASMESIIKAAQFINDHFQSIDVLINNAGVMWLPQRITQDGFEMHIGTNHFGHFALTGLLLPALAKVPGARVVTVSSLAHWAGTIDFDDIQHQRDYQKNKVYSQSKLANLLFAYELQRFFQRHTLDCISVAAHPGIANTNLVNPGFEMEGSRIKKAAMQLLSPALTQKASRGALPLLYAAVSEKVLGGDYIGPNGYRQFWGYPKKVRSSVESQNHEIAARLWAMSESLTGVEFEVQLKRVIP